MNKLTAKQLLMINRKLSGETTAVSDNLMKKLEDISKMPYEQNENFFYVYRNTVAKASKLGCSIATIKPFREKNNQTAILALLSLLELNKIQLTAYEAHLQTLVTLLESGDVDGTKGWIERHLPLDAGVD